jgi:hypothetical protein
MVSRVPRPQNSILKSTLSSGDRTKSNGGAAVAPSFSSKVEGPNVKQCASWLFLGLTAQSLPEQLPESAQIYRKDRLRRHTL